MTDSGSPTAAPYWLSRLAGAPDGTSLPCEARASRGSHQASAAVPPHVFAAARARARGSDRSLFALTTAAVAVSLERYTRTTDLMFAVAPDGAGGRVLPLRLHLDTNGSFKSVVLQVNTAIDEAIRFAAGVADACDLLGISHSAGVPRSCRIAVGTAASEGSIAIVENVGVSIVWRLTESSPRLDIVGGGGGPDAAALERVAEHVLLILAFGVEAPDMRLEEMPPIGPADHRLLAGFNATDVHWPAPLEAAHVRFVAQARRSPTAVAVIDGATALTYNELDRASDRIAAALGDHGLPPESMIAMLPPRDVRWAAALIGIWKAGYAYLPLDIVQTPARLATTIEASDAALVLAAREDLASLESILQALPPAKRPPIVHIDSVTEITASGPSDAAGTVTAVDPRQLAYVIFTSGSTGVPKGAMVEHGGMRNHLEAKIRALELGARDIVGVTASASFDVSVWQIMAALLAGGAVYIADENLVRDQLEQLRAVDRAGITILEVVPSQLRAMLDLVQGPDAPMLHSLRRLIANGEPLGYDLCNEWRDAYPRIPLMNAYGPTECSDDATHLLLDDWEGDGSVSIGRPLPNMRLHILDAQLAPLPIGVTGEIYIGGAGVGRGYLADPVRTASSFIPDPFSVLPGARMYRTGDRGHWTGDGWLYCSGRIDHQIKLRGFRIELGEIEAVLRRHRAVRDAAVIVRDDVSGGPALVAYVVGRDEQAVPHSTLRAFLGEVLPDYMAPAVFVSLREMPLTASGKTDRRALPAPSRIGDACETPTPRVAPRTPIEQALSEIWTELLQCAGFGIHDNFFELGGHSLVATRVVARVRARMGVELPLHAIFSAPTIAELSLAITTLLLDEQDTVASSAIE